MREINKIIIHCTATPKGRHVSVQEIYQWHIARGFNDIGYHYVIDINGVTHEGRPISRIGAHCKGYNTGSIGITYVGGCDKYLEPLDTRTKEQKQALVKLVNTIKNSHPNDITVHGHYEFSDKTCPNFDVGLEFK